ncbi:hypothetical protein LWV00_004415 [Salmonella enterica]|nr:hypothetical protein [Salmonella enterica]EIM0323171.1 hypothetical protein [Salmonella enterica]EIR3069256.1 hypothetical protein [Salmonella enterica]
MKELTTEQLATVSGANLGACSAAYWGMNGGKAGGGLSAELGMQQVGYSLVCTWMRQNGFRKD